MAKVKELSSAQKIKQGLEGLRVVDMRNNNKLIKKPKAKKSKAVFENKDVDSNNLMNTKLPKRSKVELKLAALEDNTSFELEQVKTEIGSFAGSIHDLAAVVKNNNDKLEQLVTNLYDDQEKTNVWLRVAVTILGVATASQFILLVVLLQ